MRKLILFLMICIGITNVSAQYKTLPNITIKDLDGNSVNIQNIDNDSNPIILNFWATWCKPCKNELNNIDDLYEEWKKETNVKIIIVSVDDSRSSAKVKPYINSMGWTFEALSDPNRQLARQLNVVTVPHTFLINGEGKIVYEHKGYITGDEDELYEQLKLIK
jgi:peroxiredoxin